MKINGFDADRLRVICLTLPDCRERQMDVVKELNNVGLHRYEFSPGYYPDSPEVSLALKENRVKKYPVCFRCDKEDCGDPECNNILIPPQIAVCLGFQAMFRRLVNSEDKFALFCEDDIIFAPYAKKVFKSKEFKKIINKIIAFNKKPAMIRLGRPRLDPDFYSDAPPKRIEINSEIEMSNTAFIINQAFAKIALNRLNKIDHTADVIIHRDLNELTESYTINCQLVADRSWTLFQVPSLIHPKENYIKNIELKEVRISEVVVQERLRFANHVKKAIAPEYCFIGSPRCGSHFVSQYFIRNGLDIQHEKIGRSGICAWQYAVDSNDYPYINDKTAKNSYFVYPKKWYLYARNPVDAIPSLIIENEKGILSYHFRRKMIKECLGVDLEDYNKPIEKAARSYLHWYELALKREISGILRVELFHDDVHKHFPDCMFKDIFISDQEKGVGKPYLGYIHIPMPLARDWQKTLTNDTIKLLNKITDALGYSEVVSNE